MAESEPTRSYGGAKVTTVPIFTSGATCVGGLCSPEGPVPLGDGSVLVAEMGADAVTKINISTQVRTTVVRVGRPNGLVRTQSGDLWVAATDPRATLVRFSEDGSRLEEVDTIDGRRLQFPNDLIELPDGSLLVTDSGIPIREWAPGGRARSDFRTLQIDGRVYVYEPRRRRGALLTDGLAFANGIALTPTGNVLVAETLTGRILQLTDGRRGRPELFAQVPLRGAGPPEGPDGLAVSADGHVFVAVYGHGLVVILGRDGLVEGWVQTLGGHPTNVALSSAGLLVTETDRGCVEIHTEYLNHQHADSKSGQARSTLPEGHSPARKI